MVKLVLFLCLVIFASGIASAQNATTPGKFTVEHPTLLNLGFEWPIEGDTNRNAEVAVQFRAVGEPSWRPAMPLVRIGVLCRAPRDGSEFQTQAQQQSRRRWRRHFDYQ
ncbi:hypothetical protein ACFL6U_08650 [Planctomycetota bacterium]